MMGNEVRVVGRKQKRTRTKATEGLENRRESVKLFLCKYYERRLSACSAFAFVEVSEFVAISLRRRLLRSGLDAHDVGR